MPSVYENNNATQKVVRGLSVAIQDEEMTEENEDIENHLKLLPCTKYQNKRKGNFLNNRNLKSCFAI